MSRGGEDEVGKVYVGGLPADTTPEELEDVFTKFGRLRKVWVARRPPGFAFVHFEDNRDAEDAVQALDGSKICGGRARVELSTSRSRRGGGGGGDRGGSRGGGGDRGRYDDRGGDRGYSGEDNRRSGYRARSPERRRDSRSPRRRSNSRSRSR